MNIAGLQKLTLSDYPGKIASTLFLTGCNLDCGWCHNRDLIPITASSGTLITEARVLIWLCARRQQIEGVVIGGGEPTLQDDLAAFLARIKALGLLVKLDTNGSRPEVLDELIAHRLVDFVAMDVKAPWELYGQVTGSSHPIACFQQSAQLLAASGIEHEFRTTLIPSLSAADLAAIKAMIPAGSRYRTQIYVPVIAAGDSISSALSPSRVGSPGVPLET